MTALPPPRAAEPGGAGHPRDPGDSAFETSAFERTLARRDRPRWLGWRRHALMAAAVLFGVSVLTMASISAMPSPWLADLGSLCSTT